MLQNHTFYLLRIQITAFPVAGIAYHKILGTVEGHSHFFEMVPVQFSKLSSLYNFVHGPQSDTGYPCKQAFIC